MTDIDLYYWPTPNGKKITIFLEEAGASYAVHPINIGKGEQFEPSFLAKSPNNRMPAIVDHTPADGKGPLSVFESGAILMYLAEKYDVFLPKTLRERTAVIEWLMWQMGGVGPMLGQNHHFRNYAPEKVPYAIDRYTKETNRLYGVLNRRLADRAFVCDEYSIADMAIYPWILPDHQGQSLEEFPNVARWMRSLAARPCVARGMMVRAELAKPMTDEAKKILFGQTAR
ncbi:MAG: glutathione S-transferase N-terminal domain-containing protein [Polyangiaceae bacterium]